MKKQQKIVGVLVLLFITACSGAESFDSSPTPRVDLSPGATTVFTATRSTDACSSVEGGCGGCVGTVTFSEEFRITYDDAACSYEETLSQEDWEELESYIYDDEFLVLIQGECEPNYLAYVTWSYTLDTANNVYSSAFECDEPENLIDLVNYINLLVSDYFPSAAYDAWRKFN
jgi:hypothetical protein